MELEEFMAKKLERAGFTHLDIIKTPLVTRIVIHVTKPGLAIGKGGQTIKQLTEKIATDYAIDNPQIEIQEITNPTLNAKATVDKMASMIQREFPWRSVAFRTVRDIMAAGAQGVELTVKGKIAGKAGRKRKQRIAFGYMKKVGDQTKYVDYAKASAYPKVGAIGIKLRIIHPETVFPDKIDVKKVIEGIKGTSENTPIGKVIEEKIEDKKIENKEELTKEQKEKLHTVVEKKISKDKEEKKKVEEKSKKAKDEEKIEDKKIENKEVEKKDKIEIKNDEDDKK
jgi:small subunit ribosomal protein S3